MGQHHTCNRCLNIAFLRDNFDFIHRLRDEKGRLPPCVSYGAMMMPGELRAVHALYFIDADACRDIYNMAETTYPKSWVYVKHMVGHIALLHVELVFPVQGSPFFAPCCNLGRCQDVFTLS